MNHKLYRFIIDINNVIMQFIISYSVIILFIFISTKQYKTVLFTLCLLPVPIISYLIRCKVGQIWKYVLLHLVLLAAVLPISGSVSIAVLYGLYVIIIAALELTQKLKPEQMEKENTPLPLSLIIAVLYLISEYINADRMLKLYFILLIIYILFHFANKYLLNFNMFFQNMDEMSYVPIKQIININNSLIFFFGGICLSGMLIFYKLNIGKVLAPIGQFLLRILKAILSFLLSIFYGKTAKPEDVPQQSSDFNPYPKVEGPSAIWKVIESIIFFIFKAAIIIAVIAFIVYSLYKIYQLFYRKKINNFHDKLEFISFIDKSEKLEKNPRRTFADRYHAIFDKTNNERIRKHFYKAVKDAAADQSKIDLPRMMPAQLSKLVILKAHSSTDSDLQKERGQKIASLYEKARYGREECSKEEVADLRSMLKPHK